MISTIITFFLNLDCNYDLGDCCNYTMDSWNQYCDICACKENEPGYPDEFPTPPPQVAPVPPGQPPAPPQTYPMFPYPPQVYPATPGPFAAPP